MDQSRHRVIRRGGRGHRSGLRHDGRSGENPASPRLSASHLLFLLGRLPRQICRRSGEISGKPGAVRETMHKDAIYTCPMHPEVRQVGPGACPICGMALEPVVVTAEAPANPELLDMTRRFWIGLALALPVVGAGNGRPFCRPRRMADPECRHLIQLALATPVVLWAGWPFFVRGWHSFVTRKPQYVLADRGGDRRRLGLQRRCDAGAADCSRRPFAATKERSPSISRRRR